MVDNHTCSKMQRTKPVTPGRVILLQVVRTTFTGEASGGRIIARAEVGLWRLILAICSTALSATLGILMQFTTVFRGIEPEAVGHRSTLVPNVGDGEFS